MKHFIYSMIVAMTGIFSLNIGAGNINPTMAKTIANNFLKQQATIAPGSFKAPSFSDIKIAHTEPSSVDHNACAYYVFNIDGGGFVIVSGEDRTRQVLGFSNMGRIDFNSMSDNLKALLNHYKKQIEYLQTNPTTSTAPPPRINRIQQYHYRTSHQNSMGSADAL